MQFAIDDNSRQRLAYASTVHAAQGRSTDTAQALVDETGTRETLYAAATRGQTWEPPLLVSRDWAAAQAQAHDVLGRTPSCTRRDRGWDLHSWPRCRPDNGESGRRLLAGAHTS